MSSGSCLRGHPIFWDGRIYRYVDTGQPTVEGWKERPCGYCGLFFTSDGHDGCLGTLTGVMNACCGHGSPEEAYVQFDDGTIARGKAAILGGENDE
jgi:hypothetical protein